LVGWLIGYLGRKKNLTHSDTSSLEWVNIYAAVISRNSRHWLLRVLKVDQLLIPMQT
jgi:hypothetical protein